MWAEQSNEPRLSIRIKSSLYYLTTAAGQCTMEGRLNCTLAAHKPISHSAHLSLSHHTLAQYSRGPWNQSVQESITYNKQESIKLLSSNPRGGTTQNSCKQFIKIKLKKFQNINCLFCTAVLLQNTFVSFIKLPVLTQNRVSRMDLS